MFSVVANETLLTDYNFALVQDSEFRVTSPSENRQRRVVRSILNKNGTTCESVCTEASHVCSQYQATMMWAAQIPTAIDAASVVRMEEHALSLGFDVTIQQPPHNNLEACVDTFVSERNLTIDASQTILATESGRRLQESSDVCRNTEICSENTICPRDTCVQLPTTIVHLHYGMELENFDTTYFIEKLAVFLNVAESQITIFVTAASVEAVAVITSESEESAESIASNANAIISATTGSGILVYDTFEGGTVEYYVAALPPSVPPSPPSPPVLPPAPPRAPPPPVTHITGDPHIRFAHGGRADFRGVNNTFYVLLSAPGVQFAALTTDTEFLLPRPQFVRGSFFTRAAWTLRGTSGREYGIVTDAGGVGFRVVHPNSSLIVDKQRIWQVWEYDSIRVASKQLTVYVRAHGWEVNVTRKPIYNYVSGPSHWRFDVAMRQLDGTPFAKQYGSVSTTCHPHGVIGQSYDGDDIAVSGKTDDYKYAKDHPVIVTKAMAEGAIEGSGHQYALHDPHSTSFLYSRYNRTRDDHCAPRDARALLGEKSRRGTDAIATATEIEV